MENAGHNHKKSPAHAVTLPPSPAHPKAAHIGDRFSRFAKASSIAVGRPWAFVTALIVVVVWAAVGRFYHYSDTWQLVINTGTTIITFIMVFLIQSTQNRDSLAIHLKLDEIIRSIHLARNELIDIENLEDAELERLAKHYEHIRAHWQERQKKRRERKEGVA